MNRIYLLALSALFLFSCTQTPKTDIKKDTKISKTNDLLSAEVVVKDYINIASNDNPDWIKSAVDNKVINTILDIAISGAVTVNAVDDGEVVPLTVKEINSNLGAVSDTMQLEISENVFIDTLISTPAKLEQVEGIFFKEDWIFDADNFSFTKQISEYLPVREYYKMVSGGTLDTSRKVKSLVFKVINDNNSKNFEKIASDVTTAFYFNAEEPNFINGLDVLKFQEYLLNYSYKDKKDVYDFYEQNQKKPYEECCEAIGAGTDSVQIIQDADTIETTITYVPYPSEIIGVIFVENWYLDKQTLSFKKEVTAIAPIRRYNDIDPEGETYTKTTIPYLIKL